MEINLIEGTLGSDTLFGSGDDDEIKGISGDDLIFDKNILRDDGNLNSFFDNDDNDLLSGGLGDDTLVPGIADDTLLGGAGADIFVPNLFDDNRVRRDLFSTTILDFNPVEGDQLDVGELRFVQERGGLDRYGISSFETIEALTEISSDGLILEAYFRGDKNTTKFVGINELTEEHFIFSDEVEDDALKIGSFRRHDVFGGLGDDIIIDNYFTVQGSGKDDRLFGEQGDDTLVAGFGNDTLYGGAGEDTAVFILSDTRTNELGYEVITTADGLTTVINRRNPSNDTDVLVGIENIRILDINDLPTGFYDVDSPIASIDFESVTFEEFNLNPVSSTDPTPEAAPDVDSSASSLTPDVASEIERKENQDSAKPTPGNDTLIGTSGDDFVVGSVGDDLGQGLTGNDEYFWENKPENSGGSFTVEDTGGELDIVNIDGADPDETIFSRDGDDIVLSLSGGSSVILVDQFTNPQIEQVRFNLDNVLTPQDLINLIDT